MFAAAATGGDVTVKNVIPKHLEATTAKLEEIGCEVQEFDDAVRVRAVGRLHRTHVKTLPYPGYPTDMQPQIAVTLALAEGTSIVTESIFENRFKYADELSRMGACIKVEGNSAIIDGVNKLTGARVHRIFVLGQLLLLQDWQQRESPLWMILFTSSVAMRTSKRSFAALAQRSREFPVRRISRNSACV